MSRYSIVVLTFLCIACGEELPDIRSYPLVKTLNPIQVDETGATFRAEVVQQGTATTTSYGFVWSSWDPNLEESYRAVVGDKLTGQSFEVRIEDSLAANLDYQVRAFVVISDRIVYSNSVDFHSLGSRHGQWSLEVTGLEMGFFLEPFSGADDRYGYILFPTTEFYIYDPVSKNVVQSTSFPVESGSSAFFTHVSFEDTQYFFSTRSVFKFNNGEWSIDPLPFNYRTRFYCFLVSGKIYFLGSGGCYRLDPSTGEWEPREIFPGGGYFMGGSRVNNKVYILSSTRSVWEYDAQGDFWTSMTTFPGTQDDLIVSFSFGDRVYFGLGHYRRIRHDFWSYDITRNEWRVEEDFPNYIPSTFMLSFAIDGKLHLGLGEGNKKPQKVFSIWTFDPSKE